MSSEVKRWKATERPGSGAVVEVVDYSDYAALEAEYERLRDECEYLANENIELKMLIKNMRQQFPISTGQEQKEVKPCLPCIGVTRFLNESKPDAVSKTPGSFSNTNPAPATSGLAPIRVPVGVGAMAG